MSATVKNYGIQLSRYCTLSIWAVVLSFITLREPCNNQRPRCEIAWLHVTNHLYHGCPGLTFKQSQASRSII